MRAAGPHATLIRSVSFFTMIGEQVGMWKRGNGVTSGRGLYACQE